MSRSSARFETLREPLSGRRVLRAQSTGGADVWVGAMPGFTRAYASVTTRYGSLDTHLPDGSAIPDGTAHFLEHEMFQTPEGDVFDLYDARGAAANAFTSFDHTSYVFSCTSRFGENLDTLLETMAEIHVDAALVERERGIIAQEIAMYDDDASWRGWFNLTNALYVRHPVRLDIAGTPQTIAAIEPALLRRVHAAYYHPCNLVVVVAGDVDPGAVLARADAVLAAQAPGRRHRRGVTAEPRRVARREVVQRLGVARPVVLLGLKGGAPGTGRRRVARVVRDAMLAELLFGDGGRVQDPLYEEGWVDEAFHGASEAGRDYAFVWASAEVDDVDAFRRRLLSALRTVADGGFGEAEVERCRRKVLGRHVRMLNGAASFAGWLGGVALDETPLASGVEALRAARAAGLTRRLRELVGGPRAWSVVLPRSGRDQDL